MSGQLISELKFNGEGLIPAIVQDEKDDTVLMLAYMDKEAVEKTFSTGYTHFYSRSRKRLWKKGEESGNVQKVRKIMLDCDKDTLLVTVFQQNGIACHTGSRSCFFNEVKNEGVVRGDEERLLNSLYELILRRKREKPEGSYTTYLFDKGLDKILKKVGEEAAEVIIASKNEQETEIIGEMADLWFHTMVVLGYHEIKPELIFNELKKRHTGKTQKNREGEKSE